MKVNKLDLIGWIITMAEDDLRLEAVNRIRMGVDAELEDSGPCMSITEAARRANVSRTMVYRAVEVGALAASPLYLGGRRRVREADFRRWLAERRGKEERP